MLTKYMTYSELKNFLKENQISQDCLDGKEILICSIADLLEICEDCKKNTISNLHWLENRLEKVMRCITSPINLGNIHISELDHDALSRALFNRNDNIVIEFWQKGIDPHVSPSQSIRYLTIRISDETVWWSNDVFTQMEQYINL